MALLEEQLVESDQGFRKVIDKDSQGLLMDMAQSGQYSKPIESTIREIASNGVDSHKERENAKKILLGEAKVEDFYVEQTGDIYKASHFNPSYYDLNWLSDEKNIKIEYFRRDSEDRDLLRITDYGVGLGGSRLEGYMSLSYSTKRLNKFALGKFGIGGKAPLSTQIDYFTMKSNYNGEHVEFDIYLRKIDSLIPKWNNEGEENTSHQFSETSGGYIYYSTPTTEKNSVTIELEVKKHQRDAYKTAVVNQLLYFDNVEFYIYHDYDEDLDKIERIEKPYSFIEEVPVTTEIYYSSENFLISKNNLYTKPHVVIGQPGAMINYGLIDWAELELTPRVGNVGIILNSSEVDITPSRENVIWSNKTKLQILGKFEAALKEANDVVNKELEDPDFLQWINKSISLLSTNGSNQVVRQLSGLIDKTQIVSVYQPDPTIKYDTFQKMIGEYGKLRAITASGRYYKGKNRVQVDRKEIGTLANADMQRLYFTRGEAEANRDTYIQSQSGGAFYLITIPELSDKYWAEEEASIYLYQKDIKQYTKEEREEATKQGNMGVPTDPVAGYFLSHEEVLLIAEKAVEYRKGEYAKALRFLELSKESELYHSYEEVEVPEDWKADLYDPFDHQEIAAELGLPSQAIKKEYVDNNKRRKDNGLVLFKYANFYQRRDNTADFGWKQKEDLANTLNSFQGTLVYATQPDKAELEKFWEDVTPQELAYGEDDENKIEGSRILKNIGNLDTDENLLKVVAGLLLGEVENTYEVANPNTEYLRSNNKPFIKTEQHYSLYPYPVDDPNHYDNKASDLMLIKVAKPLAKKLTDFIPIREFVLSFNQNNTKVSTHAKLMNWYTAKRIAPIIHKLAFLTNFGEISSYHAKEWMELYKIVRKHNILLDEPNNLTNYPRELHSKLVHDFDDLADFQLYVRQGNHSVEEIAEYALNKLGSNLSDATIIDVEIYDRAIKLLEWATPIMSFLNNVPYFIKGGPSDYSGRIKINETTNKEEFLESVRGYLRSKSVEMIELPQEDSSKEEELDEDEDEDFEDED